MWIGLRDKTREGLKMDEWKCKHCGECCKFFCLPAKGLDLETELYLEAHGVAYDGEKIIIPLRCKYLTKDNLCRMHADKFSNCKLAGKFECEETQKCLQNLKNL